MAAMKFYMTPGSCSTAIYIILEELEEVFEAHIVSLPAGDHLKPEYAAVNPKSTIPALVRDDGSVLTEVPAIAYWLGRTKGRGKFWPGNIEDETRAIELMAYVAGTVHGQGFARIFAPHTFIADPALHEAVQRKGREIVALCFNIIAGSLAGDVYASSAFSAADAVLFYCEFWADKLEMPLPPRLAAHYEAMLARPVVRRVLQEEGYNVVKLGRASPAP